MKNIGVFLSAADVPKKYLGPARKFARLLAQNKFNLVWGGSDKGLMKIVADEVQQHGGKLISVTMPLVQKSVRLNSDEIICAQDLSERKKIIAEKANVIVVLVGGIGTLDEVTELLEFKKHGVYNQPIIFLNTANFYDGLKKQLEKMEAEGFLPRKLGELVHFAATPEEVFKFLSRENNN